MIWLLTAGHHGQFPVSAAVVVIIGALPVSTVERYVLTPGVVQAVRVMSPYKSEDMEDDEGCITAAMCVVEASEARSSAT
jgi:hypothetical protein